MGGLPYPQFVAALSRRSAHAEWRPVLAQRGRERTTHRLSRTFDISNRVDELLDRRRQLAQRLKDHQIDRLVRALHDSRVSPEPEDLNVLAIRIADFPSGSIINLGAVADRDDRVRLP